jgi:hypothetical protein
VTFGLGNRCSIRLSYGTGAGLFEVLPHARQGGLAAASLAAANRAPSQTRRSSSGFREPDHSLANTFMNPFQPLPIFFCP